MSVLPPTPGSSPPPLSPTPGNCTSPATTPDKSFTRKTPQVKPSSMIDVSKIPIDAIEESESLLKPITSNSSRTSTPGNMLYIPELKGRLTSAVSDSSLWNSRNKPWLGSTSPDFRGSTFLGSPGMNMQQFAQPRKSEKVAQVSVFIVLCFRLLLRVACLLYLMSFWRYFLLFLTTLSFIHYNAFWYICHTLSRSHLSRPYSPVARASEQQLVGSWVRFSRGAKSFFLSFLVLDFSFFHKARTVLKSSWILGEVLEKWLNSIFS